MNKVAVDDPGYAVRAEFSPLGSETLETRNNRLAVHPLSQQKSPSFRTL